MRRSTLIALLLALCAAASLYASDPAGARIYREACAACHGVDGRGAPPQQTAYDYASPDLTDCRSWPREPDNDWLAVIHDGGPARGFEPMMPAFGEALGEDELRSVLAHLRRFCTNANWPRGELNLPRPLATEKAFPEDEVVFTSSVADGSVANKVVYEKRFGPRMQMEVIVPFSWRETAPANAMSGGIGDIAIGAKRAIYHSLTRGHIFSAAAEFKLPTGNDLRGFGKGTTVFEPFVSFGQLFPRDWFLHAQAGAEVPFDRAAGDEGFLRFAAGKTVTEGRFGRAWSPMLEMVSKRDLAPGVKTHWDAIPQFQVTLSKRQHIMADIGIRIPLDERDVRKREVMFYLLWDTFDGGLFDGW